MQKSIRANEHQLLYLANKAREHSLSTLTGNLWKKSLDTGKWQLRYFILYQNLLFYYDCERAERPSGVAFLESSYCEPIVNLRSSRDERLGGQQGHCFAIYYSKEGVRQYDLRADTEEECRLWIDAINNASFGKMLGQKQETEQKQLHLLQILETERRAKWHYVKQIEDLTAEVKKLKSELGADRFESIRMGITFLHLTRPKRHKQPNDTLNSVVNCPVHQLGSAEAALIRRVLYIRFECCVP
ncbi:hypothetical protein CRM22_004695 [Opisthorchis felineus]|uniref:PH domain-containing protein n=1 Tax=Opisthorchis felineus TaxID=147828 RepID=A0A4S2M1L0_OPIFE|nr:hypothetical protein CRM22_004695 [Opisthorchis felineus]